MCFWPDAGARTGGCLCLVCAWLGRAGEQGGHLCRWDHAKSHGLDPGLAGNVAALGDSFNTAVVPEAEQLRIRV